MKFEPIIAPGFESREEMRETAVRMRLEGNSRKEIAAALGFKTGGRTLSEWLKEIPAPEWTKRPNAKDGLRQKAVAMRVDGCSYRQIGEEIGVAKSTLSNWLRDIPITEEQKQALFLRKVVNGERRAAAIKAQHRAIRERVISEAFAQVQELAESELFVAGVIAYQAEGTKQKPWRLSEQVSLMNSDPGMILLFLKWLELLGYHKSDLTFRLSIHESGNEGRALRFWSDVVGVPVTVFRKTTLKRHNPKTRRKNIGERYIGCVTIGVRKSSGLNRRIAGWFQGIVAVLASGSPQLHLRPEKESE